MKPSSITATVRTLWDLELPELEVALVGYVALINHYGLAVPLPFRVTAIGARHKRYHTDTWAVYTPRHKPVGNLEGHLTFALKYEGVDLAVLNALFSRVMPEEISSIVRSEPTGRYSRRIWFFYEWLTGRQLDLPDVAAGDYVDALDPKLQYVGPVVASKRHRVRNNLPGVQNFCPLIRRTEKLEGFRAMDLAQEAAASLGKVHPDLVARAAAFLLLKDSKASYAIEGERPPHNRAERWGRAIGQAGQQPLSMEELLRLQSLVIADPRFTKMGWRTGGGFIGMHDRSGLLPIPDHISARWQDVPRLTEAVIAVNGKLAASDYDAVLSAALIAFGFVFIHPLEDGNGRIHRYLIHHVLTEKGFAPKGFVFPVSAVILERLDEYRKVLEAYSRPRLPLVEWVPTERGNVEVVNETVDLYRFFDATAQAEFLYDCVRQTVKTTLPEEVRYLACHDQLRSWIENRFDMPGSRIELLISFLRQGEGRLSKRALQKEFSCLSEEEGRMLEDAYREAFDPRAS